MEDRYDKEPDATPDERAPKRQASQPDPAADPTLARSGERPPGDTGVPEPAGAETDANVTELEGTTEEP